MILLLLSNTDYFRSAITDFPKDKFTINIPERKVNITERAG